MNQLTFRSRQIVIICGITAAMLILALVLLLVTNAGNGEQGQPPPFVAFSVIGLGLIGAVLMAYSRITRGKYADHLSVEYYGVYEDLVAALQNSSLSVAERTEIQLDILGMLVQAEQGGRPPSDVVDSNLSSFVANIESSYGYRGRIGFYLLNGLQYFIFLLCVSQAAIFAMRDSAPFLETPIGVQLIPFGILLAFGLIPLMTIAVARQKVVLMVALPIGFALLYLASKVAMQSFFAEAAWSQFYRYAEVGFIVSWETALLWVVLFAIAVVGKWLLRRLALMKVHGS
jgi:DNA-binding ferritin-like protein (Dps family)|tara:strand:+ start:8239 stop:9099 length:861 start_codon:yes stop_codon:yes gene_type:complete